MTNFERLWHGKYTFFYFILLVVYKYIINGIFKIIVGGQMNVLETLDLEEENGLYVFMQEVRI